jgi:hypothetical protein
MKILKKIIIFHTHHMPKNIFLKNNFSKHILILRTFYIEINGSLVSACKCILARGKGMHNSIESCIQSLIDQ